MESNEEVLPRFHFSKEKPPSNYRDFEWRVGAVAA
jgi:hypothetical protein